MSGYDDYEPERDTRPRREKAEPSAALVPLKPKQITEDDIVALSAAEIVLLQGDLSVLSAAQRVEYYGKVCESVGLNPLTKPFDYIVLNGKLTLYAKKDATDQLRRLYDISVSKLEREEVAGIYTVTAYGQDRTGRTDSSLGAVPIENLRGEGRANAMMKAETKAKRRLTLSMAGLGWLDETEVGSIESAQAVVVTEEGEILRQAPKTLAEVLATPVTSEAPVQAPGPQSTAPAPAGQEDATETLPVKADEPPNPGPEAPVEAETPEPETEAPVGLSLDAFNVWRRQKFVPVAVIAKTAKALFGGKEEGFESLSDLTDEQRLYLQSVLTEQLAKDVAAAKGAS